MNRRESILALAAITAGAGVGPGLTVARAADKPSLRFCSDSSAVSKDWKEAYADDFTKEQGTPILFVDVPNSAAAVIGAKGRGTYDLAYLTYISAIMLSDMDALEPLDEKQFPKLKNIPERYRLKDKAGNLIAIGAYQAWYGIAYNHSVVSPSEVDSWKKLAESKWKGKLALNRPLWTAAYDLTILSHATGGTDANVQSAIPLFTSIAKNAVTSYSSNSQMAQLLERKEIVAGPYYSHRIMTLQREGNVDLAISVPKEGALSLPYCIGIPKGSKNREAAMDFLRYMMEEGPIRRISKLESVITMDQTLSFTAEQEQKIGMKLEDLSARIYAPDWRVIYQQWKDRTSTCERIFAS
ncbi:hypothetical protein ASG35_12410 [Burkholderia sp. Leaf177]|uniref:extracellular solute-binding protein n=1 Tax=Burkholderia sp. Leaf177 TaxID=1736287 RepID=UPI0006F599C5|nr:extracellular solute-binding protein [Burkholderia sp. Leaf177]KQR77064.1 hypothetical protein ASG35_12410 [Burkholderia sp. Leaf177]